MSNKKNAVRPFQKSNSRLYRHTWEPGSEDAYGMWSWDSSTGQHRTPKIIKLEEERQLKRNEHARRQAEFNEAKNA